MSSGGAAQFKRSPVKLLQTWTAEEIEQILTAIDTENPVGKRNYAMFLLMARTGLRISDVVSLKFSNIDWKSNSISLVQQKTGNNLGLPLSKELGMAIISYLKNGRPQSSTDFIFICHTAPYDPLDYHNNNSGNICEEPELPCLQKGTQAFIHFAIRLPQICSRKKHRFRIFLRYWVTAT